MYVPLYIRESAFQLIRDRKIGQGQLRNAARASGDEWLRGIRAEVTRPNFPKM